MEPILLGIEPPLARLSLNRPDRRNAMARAMWLALPDFCARIEASAALVVIVEGAGGHFCAGADISEFDEVYRDSAAARAYIDAIQTALNALAALDRPTIARIEGNCIGGGMALALACDVRFCADDALLAITPARLGLVYGFAETKRLVEAVGPARAKDLLFSARDIAPAEALAMGLVDRAVAPNELWGAVMAYAEELSRLSQQSIRAAKAAVAAISGGLAAENAAFRALVELAALGADFAAGRAAFAAKRAPAFAAPTRPAPPRSTR
jgi:enoyl-CoA hydratase/carnithine racemase